MHITTGPVAHLTFLHTAPPRRLTADTDDAPTRCVGRLRPVLSVALPALLTAPYRAKLVTL